MIRLQAAQLLITIQWVKIAIDAPKEPTMIHALVKGTKHNPGRTPTKSDVK